MSRDTCSTNGCRRVCATSRTSRSRSRKQRSLSFVHSYVAQRCPTKLYQFPVNIHPLALSTTRRPHTAGTIVDDDERVKLVKQIHVRNSHENAVGRFCGFHFYRRITLQVCEWFFKRRVFSGRRTARGKMFDNGMPNSG